MASHKPWLLPSAPPPDVHIRLHGVTFHLNKKCMVTRSAKLAKLLALTQDIDLSSHPVAGNPVDPEAFELAARFCYGQCPELTSKTVIPVACAASYLEITEGHDNLLKRALSFFNARVLPSWNETLIAYRTVEPRLCHARHLGLVDALLRSISEKALADPCLLGDPIRDNAARTEDAAVAAKISTVRRRLFVVDWYAEDLSSLPVPLFELAMSALTCSGVAPAHLTQCVYQYAGKWIDHRIIAGAMKAPLTHVSEPERIYQRDVVEAVERVLPRKVRSLHVGFLCQMLRSAVRLQASPRCRNGFEARIGELLPEASVDDLFIPCYGYTKETRYDVQCVTRIMSHFCASYHNNIPAGGSSSELEFVSELIEGFLVKVARDENLGAGEFVPLLGMLAAVTEPTGRCHDGLYLAINVYLEAHGHLTDSEREEVCKVLDCRRMSEEACEHAVQNERLPLRSITQVLFSGQLRIREAITGALEKAEFLELEGEGGERRVVEGGGGDHDDEGEVRKEMVRMDGRVGELERECVRLRKEIIQRCSGCGKRREKWGLWKEVRDLLGCKGGRQVCNCHVVNEEKVHPRTGGA